MTNIDFRKETGRAELFSKSMERASQFTTHAKTVHQNGAWYPGGCPENVQKEMRKCLSEASVYFEEAFKEGDEHSEL